jgi:putative spermidine/putrescine transport system substrate-binding protein/putrescine transport system substrate-binding protein
VRYQEFDSNDTLMSKLLVGNSGYDVVVPSDAYFGRQLQAGCSASWTRARFPIWPSWTRH